MPYFKVSTSDVNQTYILSTMAVQGPVYIEALKEMGTPVGEMVRVVRPLYGIPDSASHWYLT